ncbi:hypothetical protein BJ546DRAFT_157688 [Cryomyces antarcticus]
MLLLTRLVPLTLDPQPEARSKKEKEVPRPTPAKEKQKERPVTWPRYKTRRPREPTNLPARNRYAAAGQRELTIGSPRGRYPSLLASHATHETVGGCEIPQNDSLNTWNMVDPSVRRAQPTHTLAHSRSPSSCGPDADGRNDPEPTRSQDPVPLDARGHQGGSALSAGSTSWPACLGVPTEVGHSRTDASRLHTIRSESALHPWALFVSWQEKSGEGMGRSSCRCRYERDERSERR